MVNTCKHLLFSQGFLRSWPEQKNTSGQVLAQIWVTSAIQSNLWYKVGPQTVFVKIRHFTIVISTIRLVPVPV